MIILGLNFGHDASISIIKDGKLLICLERERINKNKHSIGLRAQDIVKCLEDVDLTISDIDFAAITNSQLTEYIFFDENLKIDIQENEKHIYPSLFSKKPTIKESKQVFKDLQFGKDYLLQSLKLNQKINPHIFLKWLQSDDSQDYLQKGNFLPSIENFINCNFWQENNNLEKIKSQNYNFFANSEEIRFGFHHPCLLKIFQQEIPAYIISHHHCHAAYSYYNSGYKDAAILTIDGGVDGFFFYAKDNQIHCLSPNFLYTGTIFDYISHNLLNLDPGKMMGLASFNKDNLDLEFRPFLENNSFPVKYCDIEEVNMSWMSHFLKKAKKLAISTYFLGDKENMLDKINLTLAASTQKMAQNSIIEAVDTLRKILENSQITSNNLCLSGGVFLNCPTNREIIKSQIFKNNFLAPALSDCGIGIGAALYLYHNIMDFPFKASNPSPKLAYLGLNKSLDEENIRLAIEKFSKKITYKKLDNSAKIAAKMLVENKVIAWMEGRSENGPRALGHRSILANPLFEENQNRVNEIKKREYWRPFAPAILEEDLAEYFEEDVLKESFFMLINSKVKSQKLPAITHIDNSARVQLVNQDCGKFYNLLKEFSKLTGVSCLLNTSFNGPKQPIIEESFEAIQFFLDSNLEALFIEDFLIEKKF